MLHKYICEIQKNKCKIVSMYMYHTIYWIGKMWKQKCRNKLLVIVWLLFEFIFVLTVLNKRGVFSGPANMSRLKAQLALDANK